MNTVKITAGKYRGLTLVTPGEGTHPMGARERLALFNMIAGYLEGARILDAYAGSGALGIEALSRGANEALFVEKSHVAMRTIMMNCAALGLRDEEVAFYRGSVAEFDRKIVQGRGLVVDPRMAMATMSFPDKVEVILADPPYDNFVPEEIGHLANDYLSKGGILGLSHPGETPELTGLNLLKTKKYAGARISIYQQG
ncbi:RsmD family RNA methyltransferase [Candidatus Saccharibacteria bacterium]|nr:RsmD family RNA methyltransferase [Candidatus Saccharibacteria bacterium]